jgi:hypothetical protein
MNAEFEMKQIENFAPVRARRDLFVACSLFRLPNFGLVLLDLASLHGAHGKGDGFVER